MTLVDLPQYQRVGENETGGSFGIEDWETYRLLCRTALRIIEGYDATMGIYQVDSGCGLDFWIGQLSLTLLIDCQENELSLFAAEMDSVRYRTVVVSDSSPDSWRELGRVARKEIRKNA